MIPCIRQYTRHVSPRIQILLAKGRKHGDLEGSLACPSSVDIHPKTPVKTRFAPSPTGSLHFGSLRTALYNYLLAKSTSGEFLLRIEDTDRDRYVPEAENDIYSTLKWCGINWDYPPERQSERLHIYTEYAHRLLNSGHAYRCFCSKERLDLLRKSAMKLLPPTNMSYDRHCGELDRDTIEKNIQDGIPYTIRLRSPPAYAKFNDLLHGKLNLQPQVNIQDRRYDDPILMKTDGFPTYHLANVVDDHLMGITHVIRGEEWLPSTPKHIAIYSALGWTAPYFIHIPLITSADDKKLSKRKQDLAVASLKDKGILPEALISFVALFGWSPSREASAENHDLFDMDQLVHEFNLNGLTKGNAKLDMSKLKHLNRMALLKRLDTDKDYVKELVIPYYTKELLSKQGIDHKLVNQANIERLIDDLKNNLSVLDDFFSYVEPLLTQETHMLAKSSLEVITKLHNMPVTSDTLPRLASQINVTKRELFQALRGLLLNGKAGISIHTAVTILGDARIQSKIRRYLQHT